MNDNAKEGVGRDQVQVDGLVSTIIPAFNRPGMLREAVQSVIDQTYRPIEVWIVDDGSTDETPEVAEALVQAYPGIVYLHRKENSGAGPSREAGRQRARGEFIQYLDSDDLLTSEKFTLQVAALRAQPDCGAAYGWIQLEQADGTRGAGPYKCSGQSRSTLFPWLLADRWWNTNAPLWRASMCDAIGPWSDLRWSQDWEYDARAAALGMRLAYVPVFVTIQRQHAGVRQTTDADWQQPQRIRNRREFFERMWMHCQHAQIPADNPHRKHFSRWSFATARMAARAGMVTEANVLLEVARESAGGCRDAVKGLPAFERTAKLLGYRVAGRLFAIAERLRKPGALTLRESFSESVSSR